MIKHSSFYLKKTLISQIFHLELKLNKKEANSRKDALKYNKENSMKFQEFKNDNNEIDDKIINEEIDKLAEKSKKW